MVMIIADTRFIERGGVRGLDAPHQSRFGQGVQVIVDGLLGKTAQMFPGGDGDGIGAEMTATMYRRQYGETGRGDPHPYRPQLVFEHFRMYQHGIMMTLNLDFVKKKTVSGKYGVALTGRMTSLSAALLCFR